MKTPLRILYLEDNVSDALLVQNLLEREDFKCAITRVETRSDFEAALEGDTYDLILADFSLPSFDGASALKFVTKKGIDTPFIFVSGSMGEDPAIESLLHGALDYVLKQKLSRLVPAVRRALHEAEQRKQRKLAEEHLKQSEEQFRLIAENVADMIAVLDLDGKRIYNNRSYKGILGDPEILKGSDSFQEIHPEDVAKIKEVFQETVRTGIGHQ